MKIKKYEQMTLELFNEDDKYKSTEEEIMTAKGVCIKHLFENRLLNYGIDEHYKKIAPNQYVLSQILNELRNIKTYDEYLQVFGSLCIKYLRNVDWCESEYGFNITNGYVRYFTPRKQGPAYCFSMIPFEVLMYGMKDEWK